MQTMEWINHFFFQFLNPGLNWKVKNHRGHCHDLYLFIYFWANCKFRRIKVRGDFLWNRKPCENFPGIFHVSYLVANSQLLIIVVPYLKNWMWEISNECTVFVDHHDYLFRCEDNQSPSSWIPFIYKLAWLELDFLASVFILEFLIMQNNFTVVIYWSQSSICYWKNERWEPKAGKCYIVCLAHSNIRHTSPKSAEI